MKRKALLIELAVICIFIVLILLFTPKSVSGVSRNYGRPVATQD
jgi:hypothetical protein